MKKIVAAIDLSDITPKVIETAAQLALISGAKLYLIHAEAPEITPDMELEGVATPGVTTGLVFPQGAASLFHEHVDQKTKELFPEMENIKKDLENKGISVENVLLYNGDVADRILGKTCELDANLVVIGARRHSFLHKLFFEELGINFIAKCPCPVVVVPESCKNKGLF